VAGFDISAIPAFFVLDILSQTSAAIGADVPADKAAAVKKDKLNFSFLKSKFQKAYQPKKLA